jgi:hypothetical protein
MKVLSRLLLAPTFAALLLGFASAPTNAAHRGGGSAYDGIWSVAIYTPRGTIPAQEVGGRLEENAPAVGQPRDAQAITESGEHSALFSPFHFALERCGRNAT